MVGEWWWGTNLTEGVARFKKREAEFITVALLRKTR
jgi:hypothetical protein